MQIRATSRDVPLTEKRRQEIERLNFTPKQQSYLSSTARFLLYGGGAGGGKTHVAIFDMLGLNDPGNGVRAIDIPAYTGLFLRKTMPMLRDVIRRTKEIYPVWGSCPKTGREPIWYEQQKKWVFPSGAQIFFGYIEKPGDEENYQGWEYQKICFEELTQWPNSYPFTFLHTRCRKKIDNPVHLSMRATCNPGGVGHHWVRAFWQISDAGDPNRFIIPTEVEIEEDDGTVTKTVLDLERQFIPARLDENPHLDRVAYAASLADLSPQLKRALREGRWDVVDLRGHIFSEQLNELYLAGRITDVPFDPRYPVNTFWDLGIADAVAIWFHQRIDGVDHMIDYYEFSNRGLKDHWRALKGMPYNYGAHFVPHDASHRKHNLEGAIVTIAEIMGNLGMRNIEVVPKTYLLSQAIEQTRIVLPRVKIDERKCERGIQCLAQHRFPVDGHGRVGGKPVHDEFIHGADAFRQFAQAQDLLEGIEHDAPMVHANDVPDVPHARHVYIEQQRTGTRWVV